MRIPCTLHLNVFGFVQVSEDCFFFVDVCVCVCVCVCTLEWLISMVFSSVILFPLASNCVRSIVGFRLKYPKILSYICGVLIHLILLPKPISFCLFILLHVARVPSKDFIKIFHAFVLSILCVPAASRGFEIGRLLCERCPEMIPAMTVQNVLISKPRDIRWKCDQFSKNTHINWRRFFPNFYELMLK